MSNEEQPVQPVPATWNFEYPSARKFGTILELLSRVSNEDLVKLKITSDNVAVSQMDSAKAEFCNFILDKKAFKSYECTEPSDWTLRVAGIQKWLKTAQDEESLSCSGSSAGPIHMERLGNPSGLGGKRRLIMPNSVSDIKSPSLKTVDPDNAFSTMTAHLLDFIGENPFSSELMTLKVAEDGLSVIYVGGNSSYAPTTIPYETREGFTVLRSKLGTDVGFDSTIVLDVVKPLSLLFSEILVEFGNQTFMRLSAQDNNLSVKYIIGTKAK